MGFQKGQAKPEGSGRRKGTPNKSTWYLDVCRKLEECDLDIIAYAAKLVKSKCTPLEYKTRLLLGLANLAFPKRMAIQHSGKVAHAVLSADQYKKLFENPAPAQALEAAVFAIEGAKNPGSGKAVPVTRQLPAPADTAQGSGLSTDAGLPILDAEIVSD